MLKTGYFSTF